MSDSRAPRLLVVWWSNTGGTQQLVEAACEGASTEPGCALVCRRADQAAAEDVIGAQAMLFATPECLGSMAGLMKDFFDRTYYAALDRVVGRPYATVVCAGSDGHGALRQLDRIASGWRLRRVAEPLLVITRAQSAEAILAPKVIDAPELQRARELGGALAAGCSLRIW